MNELKFFWFFFFLLLAFFFAPFRVLSSFSAHSWWCFLAFFSGRPRFFFGFTYWTRIKKNRNSFRCFITLCLRILWWCPGTISSRHAREFLRHFMLAWVSSNFFFFSFAIIAIIRLPTVARKTSWFLFLCATCVHTHTHTWAGDEHHLELVSVSMSHKRCRIKATTNLWILFHSTSSLPPFVVHISCLLRFTVWGYHVHNNNMTPSSNGT